MRSDSLPVAGTVTRRRLLSGLGTAVLGSLAGCSGQISGTGPDHTDAETTVEDKRVLWRYPPRERETEGIGYAAVEIDRVVQRDDSAPLLRLNFNSTVRGLASSEPYKGYHPDWFRFRVWPPSSYEGRLGYQFRVEPPGQWNEFSAYYDIQGSVRHSIVELQEAIRRERLSSQLHSTRECRHFPANSLFVHGTGISPWATWKNGSRFRSSVDRTHSERRLGRVVDVEAVSVQSIVVPEMVAVRSSLDVFEIECIDQVRVLGRERCRLPIRVLCDNLFE